MFHLDKKAIASDAADNVEVHPLKDEGGDGDGEGSVDDWLSNYISYLCPVVGHVLCIKVFS